MNPQRLLGLSISAVQRISVAEISPQGNVIKIGGANGAGKSSCLNALEMAFAGARAIPADAIHDGAKSGKIVVDLTDFVVTRTLTPSGGTLTVKNKDGATFASPQDMLDKLVGKISFDPFAFASLKPDQQVATLKKLAGLDFTAADASRQEIFDKRTIVNRDLKAAETKLAQCVHHADAPAAESSALDFQKHLTEAQLVNSIRAAADKATTNAFLETSRDADEVVRLTNELTKAKTKFSESQKLHANLKAKAEALPTADENGILNSLTSRETANKKVRDNTAHAAAKTELAKLQGQSTALTSVLQTLDDAKALQLQKAEYPIEGLSFDEKGVLFNGHRLGSAGDRGSTSTGEAIKACVAISMALNPTLRVILVRNGSLIDRTGMQIIAEMAEANDYQVLIEITDDEGKGCQIVFEDGAIKGN